MGKLIVLEGIDGSGKSTQFQMLCSRLEKSGAEFRRLVFPQYSEPSSALIKMYLGGEFGTSPEDVNAYAASAFFAVDRFASYKKVWKKYYDAGGVLLSDRYTTSNAVHQASKLGEAERAAFFDWLYEFEFTLMGMPEPDAVIYMDVPLETALEQMRRREAETNTAGDIHETDSAYLKKCRECAVQAAEHYGWKRIGCTEGGVMRRAEDISEEIFDYVTREVL
ncbi:MAG: deoxynucleoside kinase [Oscillospiraceae bacterium]|nr:deoxynucleoside kinase [Oscillospiraceae bacterium]